MMLRESDERCGDVNYVQKLNIQAFSRSFNYQEHIRINTESPINTELPSDGQGGTSIAICDVKS